MSDTCTLYKHAVLVENIQANAGICPKVDPNAEWIQKYYYGYANKKHIPEKQQFWCSNQSICTFPFIYNEELYYEPVNIGGDGKCGTNDQYTNPVTYFSYTQSSTILCKGNSSKEHNDIGSFLGT